MRCWACKQEVEGGSAALADHLWNNHPGGNPPGRRQQPRAIIHFVYVNAARELLIACGEDPLSVGRTPDRTLVTCQLCRQAPTTS